MISEIYWFFKQLYDKHLLKKDISLIPKGMYCYDGCEERSKDNNAYRLTGICPYYCTRSDKGTQENGYCSFIAKGDWNRNNKAEIINLKTGEILKGKDIPFQLGLLWDMCKECGKKEGDQIDDGGFDENYGW